MFIGRQHLGVVLVVRDLIGVDLVNDVNRIGNVPVQAGHRCFGVGAETLHYATLCLIDAVKAGNQPRNDEQKTEEETTTGARTATATTAAQDFAQALLPVLHNLI